MLQHGERDRSDRVPMLAIAGMCDVSPQMMYDVINGDRKLPTSLGERFDAVLTAIDAGELRFRRIGQVWEAEYRTPPNPPPPPQERMTRAGEWNEWARCRSCGGARWTPVTLHGAAAVWYLCDTCTYWETAGLGAQRIAEKKAKRVSKGISGR
jgi:hypothetical protein